MNKNAMYNLTYGLFILTAKDDKLMKIQQN